MVPCKEFRLPPGGTSLEHEFDILCHLELEPEKEEKGAGDDDEEEVEEGVIEEVQKFKSTVPNIQQYWLKTIPDSEDYIDVLVRCFTSGLDQIQAFERWSKHGYLIPYANALEEWDDIVGGPWDKEPVESLVLNPYSWI